jgi:hypothetical protein
MAEAVTGVHDEQDMPATAGAAAVNSTAAAGPSTGSAAAAGSPQCKVRHACDAELDCATALCQFQEA